MNLIDFAINYWYFIILSLILFYIYIKKSNNEKLGNFSNSDTALILEIGIYFLIIITVNDLFFNSHFFWFLSIFLFIPIWAFFIMYMFKSNDYYIIESSLQGELFHNLGLVEKEFSDSTFQKIYIMDKSFYENIKHIGNSQSPFWKTGNRIINTDYYDTNNNIFYHPEFKELHNVSFYSAKAFWLKMKKDLPELIRTNTVLTWLSEYMIAYKQNALKENFEFHLSNLAKQHEHKPFTLDDDLHKIFEQLYAEKQLSMKQKEMEMQNSIEKEISTDGDSD